MKNIALNEELRGYEFSSEYSKSVDLLLQDVCAKSEISEENISLIAVGSYGKNLLSAHSDIDLLIIHGSEDNTDVTAGSIYYPLWDLGLKVGHSVCTLDEIKTLIKENMEWSTSVLGSRLIYGDKTLYSQFVEIYEKLWVKISNSCSSG